MIGTAGQLAEQNQNRLVVEAEEDLGAMTVDPMRLVPDPAQPVEQCLQVTKQGQVTLRARNRRWPRLDRGCGGRYRSA